MRYSRTEHKRFLDLELKAIATKYCELLNTSAITLKERCEIYATMFVKVPNEGHNNGQLLLRFIKANGVPRKHEYFTAVILPMDICRPRSWGSLSWGDLRRRQIEFSEVHCVWQGNEDENGSLLCGFKGLSLEMDEYLRQHPGCVVVLGPQQPPVAYYQNLISLLSINSDASLNAVLDFDTRVSCWDPIPIRRDFTSHQLLTSLDESHRIIVQGPPGTGKTHRIAEIASTLIDNGFSVLVTAFTNRALMEVADKKGLSRALAQGNVYKTALTSDEHRQIPNLMKIESSRVPSMKGKLVLSTFYISSAWAQKTLEVPPFDYVIMDEASQALFAMVAGAVRLGKKVMWIGDQNQLPPVINISNDTVVKCGYTMLVKGFDTLCNYIPEQSYILSETFRLQTHAAELTSLFYTTKLNSCNPENESKDGCSYHLPGKRNVTYSPLNFTPGDKSIDLQAGSILDMVQDVLNKSPNATIAVLTKFRATVRSLQKAAVYRFGSKDNILIDTVERVQGITRDVCFFIIPDYMRGMSLNKELFNVATSRATNATVIVGPADILTTDNCSAPVRQYLSSIIRDDKIC